MRILYTVKEIAWYRFPWSNKLSYGEEGSEWHGYRFVRFDKGKIILVYEGKETIADPEFCKPIPKEDYYKVTKWMSP